ncbi:LOW QUALITY PROTEIN: interferon regulatory factor 9 [Mesoplodon densirostris]|uniref:LOW QUALITY PROTEIN: interferon regulatory factor 9 n=1 Tax=Mesoplodon densirostris TaxID=48708 RepID=UPI0028DD16D7|nr:LOW QUALITY PROTEIN: interferon regulatory factor 9 [Mesoplodon densirostris]
MASGRVRCTRKLRNWVVEQVESGQFPGVCWEDAAKTMFRIPWKHAGKQDFREDQDAAFFKAWAIFKGKYKEGDSEGPAIWKTRLRCALNKSSEFQEVPENGHRDGAEPYKVYRLLPPGTLPAQPGTQKSPSKRHHSSVSSERKEDEVTTKNCILSPSLLQDPLKNELVESSGGVTYSDSGSSRSSNSPEPQEGRDTAEAPLQGDLVSPELLPPPGSDYSLLLTFIYDGRVVGEAQVQSLDCRLVAEPSVSQCGMEQVIFPKPGPQEPTQRLLSQLKRGVLVASNSRGLFVQRLCPIPISWNAPQAPPGPGPHLLPSNECVELFRTAYFCRDLARYFQGLGPAPEFQVTLNFWEESPGPNHTPQSLITVQMEQAFARHLLEKTPEDQAAILSLVQSLEDPAPSPLSVPPICFERASSSTLSTCLPR